MEVRVIGELVHEAVWGCSRAVHEALFEMFDCEARARREIELVGLHTDCDQGPMRACMLQARVLCAY